MRSVHAWTDTTATIRVEGLAQSLRVMHVTDSHIALIDERDGAHLEACKNTREKFSSRRNDSLGAPIPTEKTFAEAVAAAKSAKVDLLALTGDIIHFPSKASVEAASIPLQEAGTPFLYTSGNHDWRFNDLTPSDELRRDAWPQLALLHKGEAAFSRRDVGGVRFIAADDSNYQITAEQLEFFRSSLAPGMPSVLLIHIPISLPTLRAPTIERWNAPILIGDPDWNIQSRTEWGTRLDDKETLEFVRLAAASKNLIAVLCGHIHFPHADNLHPGAIQYVGQPGYGGGFRMIEIAPL